MNRTRIAIAVSCIAIVIAAGAWYLTRGEETQPTAAWASQFCAISQTLENQVDNSAGSNERMNTAVARAITDVRDLKPAEGTRDFQDAYGKALEDLRKLIPAIATTGRERDAATAQAGIIMGRIETAARSLPRDALLATQAIKGCIAK